MSRYLDTRTIPDDAVQAIQLSILSMRLELDTPVHDREIMRRSLYRIESQLAQHAAVPALGELAGQLTEVIRIMRAPGR